MSFVGDHLELFRCPVDGEPVELEMEQLHNRWAVRVYARCHGVQRTVVVDMHTVSAMEDRLTDSEIVGGLTAELVKALAG